MNSKFQILNISTELLTHIIWPLWLQTKKKNDINLSNMIVGEYDM